MLCDSIVGSPTYMAPEVLERKNNVFRYDDPGYDGAKVRPAREEGREGGTFDAKIFIFVILTRGCLNFVPYPSIYIQSDTEDFFLGVMCAEMVEIRWDFVTVRPGDVCTMSPAWDDIFVLVYRYNMYHLYIYIHGHATKGYFFFYNGLFFFFFGIPLQYAPSIYIYGHATKGFFFFTIFFFSPVLSCEQKNKLYCCYTCDWLFLILPSPTPPTPPPTHHVRRTYGALVSSCSPCWPGTPPWKRRWRKTGGFALSR